MKLDEAPEILTVREAAELLRCGRNQAYDLIRRGDLHAVKVGRSLRVPKAALLCFLGLDPPNEVRPGVGTRGGPKTSTVARTEDFRP